MFKRIFVLGAALAAIATQSFVSVSAANPKALDHDEVRSSTTHGKSKKGSVARDKRNAKKARNRARYKAACKG